MTPPFETFAPLNALPFTQRTTDLDEHHIVRSFGYDQFARAEQPHGNGVAIANKINVGAASAPRLSFPGVDALITTATGLPLVIRCADCAPVFLVAPNAIGLVHSGKRGTLANVAGATVAAMPSPPEQILAVIGPSIVPCHYDMDLWTPIEKQLRAAGVRDIHNTRCCTACHLDKYFSYRAEHGHTGRMFALLALR